MAGSSPWSSDRHRDAAGRVKANGTTFFTGKRGEKGKDARVMEEDGQISLPPPGR